MRHRGLALLIALATGDYLLWKWSLASGHDVLSLIAGVTLLPLAALAAGRLGLALAGVLARSAQRSSRMARSVRRSSRSTQPPPGDRQPGRQTAGAPQHASSERKLAA